MAPGQGRGGASGTQTGLVGGARLFLFPLRFCPPAPVHSPGTVSICTPDLTRRLEFIEMRGLIFSRQRFICSSILLYRAGDELPH